MQITRLICPEEKYETKCPLVVEQEGITVHNTYNDASAMAEASYMIGRPDKVSFHVAIDDYRVVECLPFNRSCFAAGDGRYGFGNAKTINIEICHSKSGGEAFDNAERLAAEYIAMKLKEYGWGIDRIGTHQDRSGKYCPHRTLDYGWERFLNMIESYLNDTHVPAPSQYNEREMEVNTSSANLNVRNAPWGTVIDRLPKGTRVTVYEETDGWSRIGDDRWVSSQYLKEVSEQPTSNYVLGRYKTNVNLNVRTGPGTNNSIKKTYKKGTIFDTYELNGSWARTPSGWVCLDYCSLIYAY